MWHKSQQVSLWFDLFVFIQSSFPRLSLVVKGWPSSPQLVLVSAAVMVIENSIRTRLSELVSLSMFKSSENNNRDSRRQPDLGSLAASRQHHNQKLVANQSDETFVSNQSTAKLLKVNNSELTNKLKHFVASHCTSAPPSPCCNLSWSPGPYRAAFYILLQYILQIHIRRERCGEVDMTEFLFLCFSHKNVRV